MALDWTPLRAEDLVTGPLVRTEVADTSTFLGVAHDADGSTAPLIRGGLRGTAPFLPLPRVEDRVTVGGATKCTASAAGTAEFVTLPRVVGAAVRPATPLLRTRVAPS